jgi:hypothetical protein
MLFVSQGTVALYLNREIRDFLTCPRTVHCWNLAWIDATFQLHCFSKVNNNNNNNNNNTLFSVLHQQPDDQLQIQHK